MTPPLVPVFHPRREARRAVRQGYPRAAGVVRLCRSLGGVERLLYSRLVDAVVLDVKAAPALGLPGRFPRIPMYALSAFRPDDGALVAECHAAGFAGLLVEGVDNAIAGEWVAARTAQVARRDALTGAPNLKRVIDLARAACAADLLGNPGYTVSVVVRILGYGSASRLASAARRVAGATTQELRELGPRGVLGRFLKGRTRSRI